MDRKSLSFPPLAGGFGPKKGFFPPVGLFKHALRPTMVSAGLISFVILQCLRLHPKENLGEVKDRLQRELVTNGLPAPAPLRGKVAAAQLLTA